ncbi:MAG: ATPase domain-containing protein, partial [Chthoniobacterales bacterium]
GMQKKKLFFLNVQPQLDVVQSGDFDLSGMLAALDAKRKEIKAKRIVFDALDIVLTLLRDPAAEQREVYRLHEWLLERELTAIITVKASGPENQYTIPAQMNFMQFMVDCAVVLNHRVAQGVSQRNLRVVKYRGSSFAENESPFLIGSCGLEVAGAREMGYPSDVKTLVTTERISSGVPRLDVMLGGGYYRGAGILITGFPGTAKSTLGGAFAEAACQRGERTVFVSFDSDAGEVIRNLASVNIQLQRFIKKGLLRLVSARTITGSAETHLMRIKNIAEAHHARCVVIDPVSALAKSSDVNIGQSVAERLIDWAKSKEITILFTSLLDAKGAQVEGTPLQVSTIADTWIHLNYLVNAGERNRGLSIVKSRGTSHSNQVRELILSNTGVTLADTYTAGGEVLMGTLRWEKERAVLAARDEADSKKELRETTLDSEEALLEVRLKALQLELEVKRAEKKAMVRHTADRKTDLAEGRNHLDDLRGADKK